jgi:ribose/xylose/arabinose/galactoside ABC-type transport system permease subunit
VKKLLEDRGITRSGFVRRFGLWLVLAVVTLALAIVSPTFRDPFNLENILEQNAIVGIVACGMAIMMISGGFDLSVGAVGATSSVIGAAAANAHLGTFLAVVLSLSSGVVVGLANGLIIARVGINPFVTTFAMATIVSGLLFVVTDANSVTGGTDEIQYAAGGSLGPIPVVFIIFVLCLIAVWFFLTRTKYGHYVYSVGGNTEASHLSGVPVQRVQIVAFILGGFFAAGAGVLLLGQTFVGQPSAAATWNLQAIAICVVGGVALTGGIGRIQDVLAATLLLGVIANGLNQLSVSPYWQPAVTGIVILVAVALDQYSRRQQAALRPTPNSPVSVVDARVVSTATGDGVTPIPKSPVS